jgi:hypothetical protein
VTAATAPPRARRRSAQLRWLVHLLLIATAIGSLVVEPVLTLHVIVGLIFVAVVAVHLMQRRNTSVQLLGRLTRLDRLHRRAGRLAVADTALLLITIGMLASGLWDWAAGHPTRIRWHAITGVGLAVYLLAHTLRRRARMRRSQIR